MPDALIETAQPQGFEKVRHWGDVNDPDRLADLGRPRVELKRERFRELVEAGETPRVRYLALSGGGQYGAFGAGVLTGWTERGDRPEFDGVTGISTGALIAPLAFLGPEYDPVLKRVYTTLSTADVATENGLAGLLWGASIAETTPLRGIVEDVVTEDFLAAVASEHRAGRTLLVGTTNLDAGRPVIWDMGAIAASGKPGAKALFRDVIMASAAIPIAFPPVRFEVVANGETYEELHVDGGVTSQVSVLSPQVPLALFDEALGFRVERELYAVVNGGTKPLSDPVEPRALAIGAASISALWYAQVNGDLFRIHALAARDGLRARYLWIPDDFAEEPDEQFDREFMIQLFQLGRELILSGDPWHHAPPNYAETVDDLVTQGRRPRGRSAATGG